jgi:mono/diheme cytochrome c family protein
VGCDWPGKPKPENRPVPENRVLEFGTLYSQNCAGCHGAEGKLGPAPPLNDPLFLAIVPDAVLLQVITAGRPGTLMPAFARAQGGPLTAEQVQALAQGIKPRWGQSARAPESVPDYLPPEGLPAPKGDREPAGAGGAAGGGAQVFARACAACHGPNGEGVQKDDRLVRTINNRVFLSLMSDQVLRRYVITGRPDLGMPTYAEARPGDPGFKPLSRQEVSDLVTLLASWRQSAAADAQ